MLEEHRYSENGVEWRRVFMPPQLAMGARSNDTSERAFIEKTRNMRGSIGDLWDYSSELSQKRAQKEGKDVVKEKFYEDFSKKRGGKVHSDLIQKGTVEI